MASPPLSLRGIYESLRPPTLRDLIFSAKAFTAAAVALLAGFSQNLENPYWAVLTIYIVLNPPETGAIRSKAVFRFFGTISGGVVMLLLTGLFGDQLGILVGVTIAVIGTAVFFKQTDRTPTNYFWFSGAITAGVVGLTNLLQPTNMFDYATARMGEISLGILAITAIDSLFWPRPMTDDFLKTMADWRGQARQWMIDALSLTASRSLDEDRRQVVRQGLRDLTKAVGVIDAKAVQLPFDVVPMAPRGRHLDLVRREVVELIGDLAAIEIWARSLRRDEMLQTDLGRSIDAVTAWVRDAPELPDAMTDQHVARGAALADELAAARAELDPQASRIIMVERGLLNRLSAFVRDWSDLSLALRAIETGQTLPPRLEQIARRAKPVRSIDYLGAALDVAPMLLSMSFTTLLWYFTAWNSGGGALLFSFVGCVFLIGQGQVLRSSAGLILLILTAFAFVFLYQYAILPRVTDFPVLIAVLGCAMLPLGLLMSMTLAGMLLCVYIFAFLGLQDAYAADFNTSLQTLSASLVGLLIAVTSLHVCSYDRARFATRRLLAAVRRDILDLSRSRRIPDRDRFLLLAVDRLALYFPAAELAAAGGPLPRLRMIDDFGIGLNLMTLRRHEDEVSPGVRATIERLRAGAAVAYRAKLGGRTDDEPFAALVETALDDPAIRAEPASDPLLEALTGLHLALDDARLPPPGEMLP
ncbi:FUSC family protein [Sphingomonas abietis]|uniref:FUSC family protein n=1 Tax=Sphingomonas abietis TaxID=3012344 RepID=A0ABY7NTY9_9SPHN|nr:FUSC family protein [Sphingomonas abietis]WBO24255.1 FUSC family protein [Sphingomonas abietis]